VDGAGLEAVIFDYGGVISQSPFLRLADAELVAGLAPGTLSSLLGYGLDEPEPAPGEPYTNKWHLLEIGAIDLPEYLAWVGDRSEAAFGEAGEVGARVGPTLESLGVHWMVVAHIRRLREEGYRLAICTNNIAAFRSRWHQQFPIDLFDVVVDSSEVGVRKPDPAIYVLTCEALGVEPEVCVFVDDHPGNIAAAEALGMTGVLVGADPWLALDELDVLLTRRGTRSAARTSPRS
jgi:epoxide hydrolase-like predicted phosphatase